MLTPFFSSYSLKQWPFPLSLQSPFGTPAKVTGTLHVCLCWGRPTTRPNSASLQCCLWANAAMCTHPVFPDMLSNSIHLSILNFLNKKIPPLCLVSTFMEKVKLSSPCAYLHSFLSLSAFLLCTKFHANEFHNLQTILKVSFLFEISHLLISWSVTCSLSGTFPFILASVIM